MYKLISMCNYLDWFVSKYFVFWYSLYGMFFMIIVGMGDINNNNELSVVMKIVYMCLDIFIYENIEELNCNLDDIWMMLLSIGVYIGILIMGIVEMDIF